jgi:hypothetical protein
LAEADGKRRDERHEGADRAAGPIGDVILHQPPGGEHHDQHGGFAEHAERQSADGAGHKQRADRQPSASQHLPRGADRENPAERDRRQIESGSQRVVVGEVLGDQPGIEEQLRAGK